MLLLIATWLFSVNAFAQTVESVEIDGIYYNLVTKGKIAEVTQNPNKYSGTINIPETITYNDITYSVAGIGYQAFCYCYALTSVTIPNSVTSIGSDAFSGCSGLTSVAIPNSVTSIGSSAFYGCSGLTSVTIPNSVTSIGGRAFSSCSGLTSVTIPNSVTSIENRVFQNCPGLTSVTIPNSVTSIGYAAFRGCSRLISITIPNSVTSIGEEAFTSCSSLTSVAIPNSVTSIGNGAFLGCSGLTSITITNSVTSIEGYTFYGCSGLTSVTIPNSVTSIGEYAFYKCSGLTSVNIGHNVKSIGTYAFANCAELTDVYCYAEKVPSTESDAFADSYTEYATLHVPAASIGQYKATVPWSNFGTIVATDGTMPEPPTPEKCATPTISYSKGELKFTCETEGAEFAYEIKNTDIKKGSAAIVSLTVTYDISVYATKANYENSDTIQATLCWIEQQPQTEGITDEDAVTEVQATPVLIQTQGNTITVQGAEAGTEIILYGVNGVKLDSVVVTTGTASLNASGLSGSVAIVKIGDKTVKVLENTDKRHQQSQQKHLHPFADAFVLYIIHSLVAKQMNLKRQGIISF